jgi:hypothetical protein
MMPLSSNFGLIWMLAAIWAIGDPLRSRLWAMGECELYVGSKYSWVNLSTLPDFLRKSWDSVLVSRLSANEYSR